MRYPKMLPDGGTIGFIAPSFGCAIEPYATRFEHALKLFGEMGYKTVLGPNCHASDGLGISNLPKLCAEELNEYMTREDIDLIITCGGGELMCEILPYVDFDRIAAAEPKWYMGYSDNTNYIFLSAILADTAAIYGPCAPSFGRVPLHSSVSEALDLACGRITSVSGYELWEKPEEGSGESEIEPDPLEGYALNEEPLYRYHLPGSGRILTGEEAEEPVTLRGRLLGGCVDILTLLVGTKYDKVDAFLEKYKDDGILWFMECCDLDPLSARRAYWQMREAGWFRYAKGFLIGRPRRFGEEAMGVDQYNAAVDILSPLGVPVIMDLDIGHLPPMMPIISGALADVTALGNRITIRYEAN